MSRVLTLRPPAKINLTLRVGDRRADGYHDVRTLLQTVALSDTLVLTGRKGPFVMACRAPGVPTDRTNLVWRVADALWRTAGREGDPRDAHVRLEKNIPHAAGLGGGSADAAAALNGLNIIWELKLRQTQLLAIASEIGADVQFFFLGGTALGAGRGDELYPVDDVSRLGVVIIKPSFGVATSDAYRWLDEDRRMTVPTPSEAQRAREVDCGWMTGPLLLVNDLEAPVARRHPAIADMIDACYREGAIGAAMTGSGSAVYALFREAVAPKAAKRLARPEWWVLLTRTLTRREAARRNGL